MLEILACPLDSERPPLREEGGYLVCTLCGHGFPITDGVPDLLPESAIPPDELREVIGHAR